MLALFFWFLGVSIIVLQTALLPHFFRPEATPDLVFIFIVFCAYRFDWLSGLLLTFSIAWMTDVLVATNLGFYPLECLLVFTTLKILTTNSPVKAVVYQLPLVGVGYLFWQVMVYLLYSLTRDTSLVEWSGQELMSKTILVVVAAIPCFAIFSFLCEWFEKKRSKVKPPRRRPHKIF